MFYFFDIKPPALTPALPPPLRPNRKKEKQQLTKRNSHRPTLRCNRNSKPTPNLRLILDPRNSPRSMLGKRKSRQHKRNNVLRQPPRHTNNKRLHLHRRMHRRAHDQPRTTSSQNRLSCKLEQPNRRDTGTQQRESLPVVPQQHDDASPLGRPYFTTTLQQRKHTQLHSIEWRD